MASRHRSRTDGVTRWPAQRSAQWYAGDDRNAYIHRAWMRRGAARRRVRRPAAHRDRQHRLRPDPVQRPPRRGRRSGASNGVYEAGGIPLDLPVVSLGETQVRPTAMLWRNMAAMAIEEMLRANPIDGVVLLGGCDKTIPSLLMAAASVDLPAVVVPGGPMLTGTFRGVPLGCGTDVWRLSRGGPRRARCRRQQFLRSESSMIRSRGHCNTMGTASTMALVAEALGMVVPGVAGTPGARQPAAGGGARHRPAGRRDGRRRPPAEHRPDRGLVPQRDRGAGRRSAGRPTPSSTCWRSPGGSGIDLTLDDFDRIGSGVPLLVDLQPAGRFLMEDLHRAGGLLAVLREVRDLLDPTALTVTGQAAGRATSTTRRSGTPRSSGPAASRWSSTAASPSCAATSPPAARSSSRPPPHRTCCSTAAGPSSSTAIEDFHARIDDPDLDVDADSVLVLRGCGPRGYPGMPEVANMPLPTKLLEQGVRDMVRVCDGRMSGTAYGTVVLHVAPEAAAGGPLALVRTGDVIVLDVDGPPHRRRGARRRAGRPHARPRPRSPAFAAPAPRLGAALRRPRAAGRHRRRPGLPRRLQRVGRSAASRTEVRYRRRGCTRRCRTARRSRACSRPGSRAAAVRSRAASLTCAAPSPASAATQSSGATLATATSPPSAPTAPARVSRLAAPVHRSPRKTSRSCSSRAASPEESLSPDTGRSAQHVDRDARRRGAREVVGEQRPGRRLRHPVVVGPRVGDPGRGERQDGVRTGAEGPLGELGGLPARWARRCRRSPARRRGRPRGRRRPARPVPPGRVPRPPPSSRRRARARTPRSTSCGGEVGGGLRLQRPVVVEEGDQRDADTGEEGHAPILPRRRRLRGWLPLNGTGAGLR